MVTKNNLCNEGNMKMPKDNRNCIVVITHVLNDGIERYLKYINEEVSGIMDMIVLYDSHGRQADSNLFFGIPFFEFDSSTLQNFFHMGDRLLANSMIPLLELSQQHKYEHYLLIEYDVALVGSFRKFVMTVDSQYDADYIHIATDMEGGTSNHWPLSYIRDNTFKSLWFSWSQMFYVSRGFLDDLRDFIKTNETIHYEFLMPTMAYSGRYVVRQFENFGYRFCLSWGPANVFEKLYVNEHAGMTFYHPVKNTSLLVLNGDVGR